MRPALGAIGDAIAAAVAVGSFAVTLALIALTLMSGGS